MRFVSRVLLLLSILASMREVADLLGVDLEQQIDSRPNQSHVDETNIELDAAELERLSSLAHESHIAITEMEKKGANFSTEIGHLSIAMEQLKAESATIHHKLATRSQALKLLTPLKQELSVSVQDISTIFDGEINSKWFQTLSKVSKPPTGSGSSLESALKLRTVITIRALERSKAFYISQLRQLRKPGTNAEIVQQDILDNSMVFQLLEQRTPTLFTGLGQAYQNTMKWYYTMLFGKYGRWLSHQPLATSYTAKLLGDSNKQSSTFLIGQSSAVAADSFSIGARTSILDDTFRALPMTATTQQSWPLEILVHSALSAVEESFTMETQVAKVLHTDAREVFSQTLEFYATLLHSWISQCTGDLFGLLLVVRILQKSPLRDVYSDWINVAESQLWPLILAICRDQAKSIESAALKASNIANSTSKQNVGPHILTHLVSSFLSGVLQLYPAQPDPQFPRAVKSIVESYELFISKFAAGNEKILHTNYFVMSTLLADLQGDLAVQFAEHFKLLVDAHSQ